MQTETIALTAALLAVVALALASLLHQRARRLRLLAELAAEKLLRQAIMDASMDAIAVKDPGGRYRLVNEAAARVLELPVSEIVGRTDAEVMPPAAVATMLADEAQVLRTGEATEFETRFPSERRGLRVLRVTRSPVRSGAGPLLAMVAVGRDVSEAKHAESSRMRELAVTNELHAVFQVSQCLDEMLELVARSLEKVFPGSVGIIGLSSARNLVEVRAAWGEQAEEAATAFVSDGCWALRRGHVHGARDTFSSMICRHPGALPPLSLCLPLNAQGDLLGVLTLSMPSFDEGTRKLAVRIAEQLSLAVANMNLRETLKHQSIRDPLTGLFNRRYLEESLEREIARSMRSKQPISIIMIDIDHFKALNDSFGHEAGDVVLAAFGALVRERFRTSDILCRYGGEEFVLVLPEARLEDATERAEALREAVKQLQVLHRGAAIDPCSISIGVSAWPDHGASGADLIRTADDMLYRAKREGRDRMCAAPTRPSSRPVRIA